MKRLNLLVCCAAMFGLGCQTDPGTAVEKVPETPQVEAPGTPEAPGARPAAEDPIDRPTPGAVGVDVAEEGESELRPVVENAPAGRPRRRLNIDQLNDAMVRASGGIAWTELNRDVEVNQFDQLARTLGKPDYIQNTEEDLEPTILFQKFLGDASRSVCAKMLERDLAVVEIEQEYAQRPFEDAPEDLPQKTLLMHVTPEDTIDNNPEAVDANLRAMLMRFHGRVVAEHDDAALANWRWLLKSSRHVAEPAQAWNAMCIALFTHPDFYSF